MIGGHGAQVCAQGLDGCDRRQAQHRAVFTVQRRRAEQAAFRGKSIGRHSRQLIGTVSVF